MQIILISTEVTIQVWFEIIQRKIKAIFIKCGDGNTINSIILLSVINKDNITLSEDIMTEDL